MTVHRTCRYGQGRSKAGGGGTSDAYIPGTIYTKVKKSKMYFTYFNRVEIIIQNYLYGIDEKNTFTKIPHKINHFKIILNYIRI